VNERERDIGPGSTVEGQDHAPQGGQETDAEPADESRQARRAGVDGLVTDRGRLGGGPAPKPTEPAEES
jgi:hypothetical protein